MDSALSPREIQARIRSGASLDDVAAEAGVPTEQVEPFALPVLAELDHIVETALGCPVRRHADPGSHRSLGSIVTQVCRSHDIDEQTVGWRCWRHQDRTWALVAGWTGEPGPGEGQATFRFDLRGRYSTPQDAGARWLVDDRAPLPDPGAVPQSPDEEPTIDLNDELAIVRAVSDRPQPGAGRGRSRRGRGPAAAPGRRSARGGDRPAGREPAPEEELPALPGMTATDGVYDFVPSTDRQMDMLYEMLAGFQEDSVNIYEGLNEPPVAPAPEGTGGAEEAPETEEPGTGEPGGQEPQAELQLDEASADSGDSPAAPETPEKDAGPAAGQKPKPGGRRQKRSSRGKRASVPSWDEIMFGGPTPHA